MPYIHVTLQAGRGAEVLRSLISELTTATSRALGTPAANIRVVVTEVPSTHWATGDVTLAEKKELADRSAGSTVDIDESV